MKKTIVTIAMLFLLASVVSLAQDKPVPTVAGVYYQASSGLSRLELATSSGFKTSGVAKAAFSYGVAKVKGQVAVRQFCRHGATARSSSCIHFGLPNGHFNTGNRIG
jgi:hypothetical protein